MDPNQGLGINPYIDQNQILPSSVNLEDYEQAEVVNSNDFPVDINVDNVDFYSNLAEILPPQTLSDIANTLVSAIEEDISSRSKWIDNLKDNLKYFGIDPDSKDMKFEGASGVYSPAFIQAAIGFMAQARTEILPESGPCKIKVWGEETPDLADQAARVEQWSNYFLTQIDQEFYSEMDRTFLWSWFAGCSVVKAFIDPILRRPRVDMIPPTDFIVAQNTKSFDTSPRITQRVTLTKKEVRERQISGLYLDIKLNPNDTIDSDEDDLQTEIDNISGISHDSVDYAESFVLYEVHADIDIEGLEHTDEKGKKTGIPLPYIVTIDRNSKKILSIYRNWKETDPEFKRINYFVEFIYHPGFEIYGWGMARIAGGCAQTATAVTRQILDGLTLNNFPGGVRVASLRMDEPSIQIQPMTFSPLDTGGVPLSEAIHPLPFPAPNPMTLDMKRQFEESIMQLSSVTNLKMDDISPNMPVGTIYALIQQSSQPQSAVMKRFHGSMKRLLKIIFRLFGEYLPNYPYPFKSYGSEAVVMSQDFHDGLDIIPVSDPNMSSSVERMVAGQVELQLVQQFPHLFNAREICQRILKSMKVDNIEAVLVPEQDVLPMNPVRENENMMKGGAAKAALEQDHKAHMIVHGGPLADPNFAQQFPHVVPVIQAHIQEHAAMDYMVQMMQRMGINMAADPAQEPLEVQNQIAVQAAQATQSMMQEMQQLMQQQNPPPPDLAQLALAEMQQKGEIARAEMQQKAESEQAKLQLEASKMDSNLQVKLKELELKTREFELRMEELNKKFESERLNREAEILKASINSPEVGTPLL